MYVDCYNMRKRYVTRDQLVIAESMVDIIRARNGRPERSLAIYRNAREIYDEYLPDNHAQIGHLLIYEGDVHAELLDFATAVDRYQKANNIMLKSFGEGHLVEADILGEFTTQYQCRAIRILSNNSISLVIPSQYWESVTSQVRL